jgi:hypothetical protein
MRTGIDKERRRRRRRRRGKMEKVVNKEPVAYISICI